MNTQFYLSVCGLLLSSSFCSIVCFAGNDKKVNSTTQTSYNKKEIVKARFGNPKKEELLKKAYQLQSLISQNVVGQERVARALQDRLVQYLENLGTRKKEPIALHLIGLPGIGKSEIIHQLQKLGIPTLKIDAQFFSSSDNPYYVIAKFVSEQKANAPNNPMILIFEELDKIPEIQKTKTSNVEKTSTIIGAFNQILTDGRLIQDNYIEDVSNVFVVSTMNLNPNEIENFSNEVLGSNKDYYDFTIDDLAKFDQWLTQKPSSIPKVLSHLFRSNTVSRLVSNTLIVKPLTLEDYKKIIRLKIDLTIEQATSGSNAAKKTKITYTDQFVDFFVEKAIYAPSGARETVVKVNSLTEQVINFAIKSKEEQYTSLALPRSILLDYQPAEGKVVLNITPQIMNGTQLKDLKSFQVNVSYNSESKSFNQPQEVVVDSSYIQIQSRKKNKNPPQETPLTKKQILAARYQPIANELDGLSKQIDAELIGQTEFSQLLEKELSHYVAAPKPVKKNPPFLVIAGFPGIGKSELINLAAKYSGLGMGRINLQAFTDSSSQTLDSFVTMLEDVINTAKEQSKRNGKHILLFEELDKIFEIDPKGGSIVSRPVMNFIKDLLNDGIIKYKYANTSHSSASPSVTLDIRDSYNLITMNFAIDRFGFKADPRQTTVRDMNEAWKELKSRPANLKNLLSSMFLPETVSRLMPYFKIMKPLENEDYQKLIRLQVDSLIRDRLLTENGQNTALIDVKLSDAYYNYLFRETVIPSEGARYTVLACKNRFNLDLEETLRSIPRKREFGTHPLIVDLDFDQKDSTITGYAKVKGTPDQTPGLKIYERKAKLTFPPLEANGRISRNRIRTAAHEFGHAYVGISLGLRFEYTTAVKPEYGTGGYVRFKSKSQTAKNLLAHTYASLGSRAMERIRLSKTPELKSSKMDITSGPSSDIQQATESLWNLIYEYGMAPEAGVINRIGKLFGKFSWLPPEQVHQLAEVLQDMEDYLVDFLLKAQPREWYIEKIRAFAHKGEATEEEFYQLIGFPYPGKKFTEYGDPSLLDEDFQNDIKEDPKELLTAAQFKQGSTGTTAVENLENARIFFESVLEKRLKFPVVSNPAEALNQQEASAIEME